ncbi:hypothetical protein EGR_09593 [Echinococcus granulosus]|uniref:Uncharacterized protein n=1 Tax=Echinococcus granulosus TaxID=6210 RepID=W6U4S5_ECHGR|nr:hypothetical protein EGR_09593 [Echinococcus granulosus]EUB55556.1 hypothetical protein EGR_09593 [Echinococcus granulosus]
MHASFDQYKFAVFLFLDSIFVLQILFEEGKRGHALASLGTLQQIQKKTSIYLRERVNNAFCFVIFKQQTGFSASIKLQVVSDPLNFLLKKKILVRKHEVGWFFFFSVEKRKTIKPKQKESQETEMTYGLKYIRHIPRQKYESGFIRSAHEVNPISNNLMFQVTGRYFKNSVSKREFVILEVHPTDSKSSENTFISFALINNCLNCGSFIRSHNARSIVIHVC